MIASLSRALSCLYRSENETGEEEERSGGTVVEVKGTGIIKPIQVSVL